MSAVAMHDNHILGALSEGTLSLMEPHLTEVALARSQVIYETGTPIDSVYFLRSGLAMLVADTGDNAQVEVAMVGREGFAGTASLLDGNLSSLHKGLVQVGGSAFRMPLPQFRSLVEARPDLRTLCLGHLKTLMLQVSQCSACNARHSMSQRLCRLVLMMDDRVDEARLTVTQEDLALMLGVRRAGISTVIGDLEVSRIVSQGRGYIEVQDRAALARCACSCYGLMRNNQVLPG